MKKGFLASIGVLLTSTVLASEPYYYEHRPSFSFSWQAPGSYYYPPQPVPGIQFIFPIYRDRIVPPFNQRYQQNWRGQHRHSKHQHGWHNDDHPHNQ